MVIKAKICGLQKLEDVLTAIRYEADFIGFVFVPNRKRTIDITMASDIIGQLKIDGHRRPEIVGLFADQSLKEVNEYVKFLNLDKAQLCGNESPEFCSSVSVPVIKAIHLPETIPTNKGINQIIDKVSCYVNNGQLILLDRQVDNSYGGTGKSFDWSIASTLSEKGYEFILAGGLTPLNLGQAISTALPWAVDVSSGVETSGKKDFDKMHTFISIAHATKLMDDKN